MEETNKGISRKVDELGRIVLPAEFRQQLGIKGDDTLTMYVDTNRIILEKGQKVDELGRIVIPAGTRKALGISEKEELEIQVVDNKIILNKQVENKDQ